MYQAPDSSLQYQSRAGLPVVSPHSTSPNMGREPTDSIKQDKRLRFGFTPTSIPTLEPQILNGNPANYHSFISAFDALISFNVPEPKRKLYFLL